MGRSLKTISLKSQSLSRYKLAEPDMIYRNAGFREDAGMFMLTDSGPGNPEPRRKIRQGPAAWIRHALYRSILLSWFVLYFIVYSLYKKLTW